MVRCVFAAFLLALLNLPVAAATPLHATAINNSDYRAKPNSRSIDPSIVKVEVLLDRARFSPGEIDGKLGENAQKALRAYAEANGLPTDNPLTPEIWRKLTSSNSDPIITEYTIAEKDVKGPFLKKLPAKMEDMKHLKALNYTSPREAIAEKFHMSQELLSALNPGKKFDGAGQTILVANVPAAT